MSRRPRLHGVTQPRRGPLFPPAVAAALQRPAGHVSVRFTVGARHARTGTWQWAVMACAGCALWLDTRGRLCFARTHTGTARADTAPLLRPGAHWNIELVWSPDELTVIVSDPDVPAAAPAAGTWRVPAI